MVKLFLFLATTLFAADSNWPQFRGVGASGVAAGSPPVQWDGESGKNILWKADIPGLGHSSPVVWGDKIFITSSVSAKAGDAPLKVGLYGSIQSVDDEGAQNFNVYCFDRKTGKLLWQRTAASGVPKIKRHPKSSHANPTPATDGKHVFRQNGRKNLIIVR